MSCVVAATAGLSGASIAFAADEAAEPAPTNQEQNSASEAKGVKHTATQTDESSAADARNWVFQMRLNLGMGKSGVTNNSKADRLGFGLFAGRSLKGLSIPVIASEGLVAGAAYQTFTGVDSSTDTQWSAQSMGGQARLILTPFLGPLLLDLHGGLSLQRIVSEKGIARAESRSYGVALTSGAFVRWPLPNFENMHGVGGADLILGKASWFALAAGLEATF